MDDKQLTRFVDEVVSVFRRNRALTWGLRGLFVGLFLLLGNNLLDMGIITPFILPLFLLGGVLFGYLSPINQQKLLSKTDYRANLSQKLITSWEYMQNHPDHPLLPLLKSDTTRELKKRNPRELFPVSFFPELPLCILTGFLLIVFIPQDGIHEAPYPAGRGVDREIQRLEEIGRELTRESLKPEFRELSRLGEEMAEFAEALESGQDPSQLEARHRELTDKLLRERMQTREALERRLSLDSSDRDNQTGRRSPSTGSREQFGGEPGEYREGMEDLYEYDYEDDMYGVPEQKQLGRLEDALGILKGLAGFYGSDPSHEDIEDREDLPPGPGQNGEEGEEIDEDQPAPSSAGTFPDDSPETGEGELPELAEESMPQGVGAPPIDDSFISVFIDDLHPPEDGKAYEDWEERMISYRSMLLNQLSTEKIPAEHRDLIQTYFSLLTAE